jgi:mannose-6-phosphate isomerase-like protein (cupin superfamily)
MSDGPLISRDGEQPIAADGATFSIHEWRGSGPPQLHVHHLDDEAWHVLEGTIDFRFADGRRQNVGVGTTVFVPAGVAHTYVATDDARYLIVLTPRLQDLIVELHESLPDELAAVYRKYESELLE